jgi:hypothetical protein
LRVNRKDLTFALVGALGAVAGTGCASPTKSDALTPATENGVVADGAQLELGILHLVLASGSFSMLTKPSPAYTASSTDERVCKVHNTDRQLILEARSRGYCIIKVDDTATGQSSTFHVEVR